MRFLSLFLLFILNACVNKYELTYDKISPTLSFSNATSITGTVGTPLSIAPTQNNFSKAPLNSCVASPALPSGLSINSTSCVISGTPLFTIGQTTFTITARNEVGFANASIVFSVVAGTPLLSFAGITGNIGHVNFPMNVIPSTFNVRGSALTSCSVSSPLPDGLSIDNATCVISGTPPAASSPASYTVTATNSVGSSTTTVTLGVQEFTPLVSYSSSTGTSGLFGISMTVTPSTLLDFGFPVSSCSTNPNLPNGLNIDNSTCVISGIPTEVIALTTFIVTSTNAEGSSETNVSLTVAPNSPVISYVGASGTSGTVATAFSVSPTTFSARGSAITSCVMVDPLPAGLVIDNLTCVISGTPTSPVANAPYTITVTNSVGSTSTTVNLSIAADTPLISFAGSTGTAGNLGVAMSISPTSLSGRGAAISNCTTSPSLPSGLVIDNLTCVISGAPSVTLASTPFTVTATNSIGQTSASVTLVIAPNTPLISYSLSTGTSGTVDNAFSVTPSTLSARGAPISSCSIAPALPAGLFIDNLTCVISGTPTAASYATIYSVTVSNSQGPTSTDVTLTISANTPVIDFSGATGTSSRIGFVMSIIPTTLNDRGAAISSCTTAPALPAGLSIDSSTCVISGSPTVTLASTSFTITATNSIGSANASVTLLVEANKPIVSYDSSGGTTGNVSFFMSVTPSMINARGSAINSCLIDPALPSGLSIDNTTCVISGTPSAVLATTSYTVTVGNGEGTSTANVDLSVHEYSPILSYSGATGTNGQYGVAMSVTPTSLNDFGYAVTSCTSSPALPNGVSIHNTSCVISGTPTVAISSTPHLITIVNSQGSSTASVTLTVAPNTPLISFAGATGTSGSVANPFSVSPTSLDTRGAGITSCTTNIALPDGLSIDDSSCVISGTPSTTLSSTAFTITAINSAGSSTANVTLEVAASLPEVSYTGSFGTSGVVGIPMSITPVSLIENGSAITACSSSPSLSAGLTINALTCVISGTPTAVSVATIYTITVSNAAGSSTNDVTLTVAANSPSLSYAGATGTSGNFGTAMSITPTTLNDRGAAISSCTTSPALPSGLNINSSTCVISGTPTTTLVSTAFTVTATNSIGTTDASVTLVINPSTPLISYASSTGKSGTIGQAMSITPSTLNNRGAVITSCTSSPLLPAGLAIDNSTCVISGTPSVTLASTAFTITATNSEGSSNTSVTLDIASSVPTISYSSSSGTTVSFGSPMSVTPSTLSANGAAITSCTTSPALPAGLSIHSSTCVISGTASAILPASNYAVTATNSVGASIAANVTLTVPDTSFVANNISPNSFIANTQSLITLSYTNAESLLATVCTVSSLSNVTVTQACSCTSGVCTVGVTGVADYYGAASFNYTLSNGGTPSNSATATLLISGWYQEAYIKAANAGASDDFGTSVAISGDTAVVGAQFEDSNQTTVTNGTTASSNNSSSDSGTAYIYKRTGNTWAQEAYIKAVNVGAGDGFSYSVSISGDTVAIGSPGEDSNLTTITNGTTASTNNSFTDSGAVYVYKRTGSTWAQEAYIKAVNNTNWYANFGGSVKIEGDTLAVGAWLEPSNQTTITNGQTASTNTSSQSGAVYVYKRTGNRWAQEAYIKASNADSGDSFGVVGLSGNSLVVSAGGEDSNQTTITNGATASSNNSSSNAGAAYVYKRTGVTWAQEAYLKASNSDPNDFFGNSVAMSGDTIVVAASSEDSNQTSLTNGPTASADNSSSDSGAVYVYKRTGSNWVQEAYLKASNSGANDRFGTSSSINGDTIVVGAQYEDSNQATITNGATASANNSSLDSGAAYVYKRTGSTWVQEAYLKASNSDPGDHFGITVAISGDTIIVGAPNEGSNQTTITNGSTASADNSLTSGAAYVYRNRTRLFEPAELSSSTTATSITLNWIKSGGAATGYYVAYAPGSTPPASCTSGTSVNVGDVSSYSLTSLPNLATYSFRICSTINGVNFSEGVTVTRMTDDAPVANAVSSADFLAGTQSIITLSYSDTEGHLAQTCSILAVSNVTISQACTCTAGVCTVGVTGTAGYVGAASISYTVTGNGLSSNSDTASFLIIGWYQEAYIKASNSNASDYFGNSVAISGETVVVGAPNEDSNQTTITNGTTASSDNSSTNSGAAYVYKRTGSNWAQEAYIKAANAGAVDFFGVPVAISGDTIVIGASYEDSNQTTITNGTTASSDNSSTNSGAAYVYKRTGSNWAQEAYIKAANADASDLFGSAVSISGDTIVIGANNEDSNQTSITNGTTASSDNSSSNSGAVYVYKRTGSLWSQEAYLKASNSNADDLFGYTVAISGNTIVVGAQSEDSNQTTITNGTTSSSDNSSTNSGAAYVYKRTGSNWAQEAYIKAANADASDVFGSAVSISGDTIVVGASQEDSNQTTITNGTTASTNNSSTDSGAAYVYKRTGTSWAQEAYIKAANAGINDIFGGYSVSISGDTIVVGASQEDSNQTTITNGTTASTNNSSTDSGAAYVYKRTGTSWAQEAYIKAVNRDANDVFGAVSISGDTIVVGAVGESSNQITITNGTTASSNDTSVDSGAAYVYRHNGRLFDVSELTASATSSSVTLNWIKSGGNSTGYFVAYAMGSTAPANCSSGTTIDVGNVASFTETLLSSSTTYSFRVCATKNGTLFSEGTTVTVTTSP